jgi:exopolysaccharide production protein ExoZ
MADRFMKPQSTIYSLQILRAVAAMLVVMHHTIRAFAPAADPGEAMRILSAAGAPMAIGVDIFFVISGFIMVHIAGPYVRREKPLSDFAAQRFIRIYPMYLVGTLMLLAIQAASYFHGTGQGYNLSLQRIVSSLLIFPSFNDKHLVQPVLGVGWTLSYEIFFYAAFMLALLSARRLPIFATLFAVLLACNVLATVFFDPNVALTVFLGDRIMFEFLFGCAVALAYRRNLLVRIPAWAIAGLLAAALFVSFASTEESQWRFCCWGAAACLVVMFALRVEGEYLKNWKFMQFMGKASYSLYVFHIIALYYLLVPLFSVLKLTGRGEVQTIGLMAFSWCALIAIGAIFHLLIEDPVHSTLMRRYKAFAAAGRYRKDVSAQQV